MILIHNILAFEEGLENEVYLDTEGYPTIGIGKRIGIKGAPLDVFDIFMPDKVAKFWLNYEIEDLESIIRLDERTAQAYENCNEPRKDMLVSVAYQTGFEGLCDFHDMLAALEHEDFDRAADEMLDSKMHKQTPARCERQSETLRLGDYSLYEPLLACQ